MKHSSNIWIFASFVWMADWACKLMLRSLNWATRVRFPVLAEAAVRLLWGCCCCCWCDQKPGWTAESRPFFCKTIFYKLCEIINKIFTLMKAPIIHLKQFLFKYLNFCLFCMNGQLGVRANATIPQPGGPGSIPGPGRCWRYVVELEVEPGRSAELRPFFCQIIFLNK